MRLYLSSFRLGKHHERLVKMTGRGGRALIVMNACDSLTYEGRSRRFQDECSALQSLGFQTEELDLRDYFGQTNQRSLEVHLRTADILWVRGGNTFVLLRALRQSGLDQIITRLLEKNVIVYGGYSAAIAILSSIVRGIELIDNPNDVPTLYDKKIIWEGLGLLPFAVAPHYRSDHPESEDVERLVQYYIDHHQPFIALRDGQVIIQDSQVPLTVLD